MRIEYDPAKRNWTLLRRDLDFEDARIVFRTAVITFEDDRFDYGEERSVTVGYIEGRMVHLTWTSRGDSVRVISMRYANERERTRYGQRL